MKPALITTNDQNEIFTRIPLGMTPPYPFRHELHTTLSERKVAAMIANIRGGRGISISAAKELLGHPDERIFLAVFDIFRAPFVSFLRQAIKDRVSTLLETEKDVGWSPILDVAAPYLNIDESERAKILAPWFRKADAASNLNALKHFKAPLLFRIAAREIRSWSPELVDLILQRNEDAALQLGRNRYLQDPASVTALFQYIVRVARGIHLPESLSRGLQALFARISKLPPEFVSQSLSIIKTCPGHIAPSFARALAENPGFTDAIGAQIISAMERQGAISASRLSRRDRTVTEKSLIAAELVSGRYCSVTTARRALEKAADDHVRLAAIKRPELLRDRAIRKDLKQSRLPSVWRALLQSASPEEATILLEEVATMWPKLALQFLKESWARGMTISAKTMACLLQLEDRALREDALRVIADVRILPKTQDERPTMTRARR